MYFVSNCLRNFLLFQANSPSFIFFYHIVISFFRQIRRILRECARLQDSRAHLPRGHPLREGAAGRLRRSGRQTSDSDSPLAAGRRHSYLHDWAGKTYICIYIWYRVHRRFIIQRGHAHTRPGNWSESGFGSLRGAPLNVSRCLGGESTPRP